MKQTTIGITILSVALSGLSYILQNVYSPNQIYLTQSQPLGNTFYVAQNGSDSNPGSESQPFATFAKASSSLKAGDSLLIRGGKYTEQLRPAALGTEVMPITIAGYPGEKVTIDGNNNIDRPVEVLGKYITVSNLEVINAKWACVIVDGEHNTVESLIVHDCYSHGIYTDKPHINILNNTVYNTNLENKAKTKSSGWGSAIKMRVGATYTTVAGNKVYNNYGEGVAATRASQVTIANNLFYDNYYVNIYIDNSYDVTVKGNLTTCTDNSTYTKNGKRPAAIALAEEYYEGWGNKLNNITITNNIAAYCGNGITYWGADQGSGGLRNTTIINNTFYGGTHSAISIAGESGTTGSKIQNNLIHSPTAPWIEKSSGISLSQNYWLDKLPSSGTNAISSSDLAGSITFSTMPPAYNLANDYVVKNANPSFGTSVYGATDLYNPTLASSFDVDIITSQPIPSPTIVPTQSPLPSPTLAGAEQSQSTVAINTSKLKRARVGSMYDAKIKAIGLSEHTNLKIRSQGLPKGLSIKDCNQRMTTLTCTLSGKPRKKGTYSVTLRLFNNNTLLVTRTYPLVVN